MSEGFSEELRDVSAGIWAAELVHPFVRGLGEGSLSPERFRFYLEQDYLFLIDYARVFALAAAKAQTLELMTAFAGLCADTLKGEMALHRSYCAEFGITEDALQTVAPAQTTKGYTGHLLQVAAMGDVLDIVAVVLPCQWGYAAVATHLREQGMPAEPRYRKWIEMYASAEFEAYGRWLRGTMDRLAPQVSAARRARLKEIFHLSSRWEYLFWEQAWRMEQWAVPE